jgi:hypothetical protein
MEEADGIAVELLPPGLVSLHLWQPADAMPFQTTVQRRASQRWNRGLQGVQTVIERQQSVLAKPNDDGLLLDGQDGGLGNCWTSSMIRR